MKKTELKGTILANIAVLAISVLMLAAMSFAWFLSSVTVPTQQSMHIGEFQVDLSDDNMQSVDSPRIIAVEAAYPQTRDEAVAAAEQGAATVYAFEVINSGTVAAQIRISAQVQADTGLAAVEAAKAAGTTTAVKPLSGQIRFLARAYKSGAANKPDWAGGTAGAGGYLFVDETDAAHAGRQSLKQFFNALLLEENGASETGETKYTANALGTVPIAAPGNKVYFELLVWLDADANVESTGADTTGDPAAEKPRLEFTVRMDAMQSGGGAHWLASEVADRDFERVPPVKAAA